MKQIYARGQALLLLQIDLSYAFRKLYEMLFLQYFLFLPIEKQDILLLVQKQYDTNFAQYCGQTFLFQSLRYSFVIPHMRFSQLKNVYELILTPNPLCKILRNCFQEKAIAFSFAL
jgi:hypothetical protein